MTHMPSYLIILNPDRENGGYTVSVPALPGCVTHGETVEDAIANAREAIAAYLHDETPESLAAAGVEQEYLVVNVEVPLVVTSDRPHA
jgi:predicted RNase H-like HicB family nuclease